MRAREYQWGCLVNTPPFLPRVARQSYSAHSVRTQLRTRLNCVLGRRNPWIPAWLPHPGYQLGYQQWIPLLPPSIHTKNPAKDDPLPGRCAPLCRCSSCPTSSFCKALTKILPRPYRKHTVCPLAAIGGVHCLVSPKGKIRGAVTGLNRVPPHHLRGQAHRHDERVRS